MHLYSNREYTRSKTDSANAKNCLKEVRLILLSKMLNKILKIKEKSVLYVLKYNAYF